MGSESDLDLMLASAITKDERQEQAKEDINKLKVTKGTHAKIQLYADLTSRITDCGMECYGYLLKPKWSTDNLITDAYFADELLLTSKFL